MSSENFDKIFREKLDGIQPEYHPSVWNRIQSKMPVSPFYLGLKKAAPWAYGTVTTLMLFWMAFQMQDLKTETHRLKDSVRHTEEVLQQSKLVLDEIRNRKPDTVYLASSNLADRNSLTPSGNGGINRPSSSNIPPSFDDPSTGRIASQPQSRRNSQVGNHIAGGQSGSDKVERYAVTQKDVVSGKQESALSMKSQTTTDQRTASDQNLAVSTQSGSQPVIKEPFPATSDSVIREKNQPEVTKKAAPQIDSAVAKKENAENVKSKSSFRFSDLNARVGLGVTMAAPSYIGFGPDLEVRLSQNLGLSVGLTAYSSTSREYASQEEFNRSTGYVFQTVYKNSVSADETGIHDIRVETSNIEVPIRLKYYSPVSDSYSLIFSAGTHFNISNVDKVRYEAINGYNEEYRTFSNNSQSSVFHNFILGVGLERRGAKVDWQILPYYTYNFRQQGIYEDKKVFGLTLTAWLPLSQK